MLCKDDFKVLGVVVAYNPDMESISKNISISLKQLDEVLVVNNSEYEIDFSDYNFSNVKVINNYENLGISKALNIGIDYAKERNYPFVLLLDQDSSLTNDFIKNMKPGFSNELVAMICPNVVYLGGKNCKIDESLDFEEIKLGITSGSLLNMNVLKNIQFEKGNFFNEDFFIDCVDFDFSLTIRDNNFIILRCNNANLYHQLGNVKTYKIGNIKLYPTNHNYIRRYYITRNRLYMWKKYFKTNKKYVIKDFARSLYEFALIILYEDDKKDKLKSIWKGIVDFSSGKVGKIQND